MLFSDVMGSVETGDVITSNKIKYIQLLLWPKKGHNGSHIGKHWAFIFSLAIKSWTSGASKMKGGGEIKTMIQEKSRKQNKHTSRQCFFQLLVN